MAAEQERQAFLSGIISNPTFGIPTAAQYYVAKALGIGGPGKTRKHGWDRNVEQSLKTSLDAVKNLRSKYMSGELSGSDYLSQVTPYLNAANDAAKYMHYYSNYAVEAAQRLGSEDVWNLYQPELKIMTQGRNYLGRDLRPTEVAQLRPAFQEGDIAGEAALAQYAEAYKRTPEYLRTQAPQQYTNVNQVFSELMKRGATQGELDHFGQMLATGETDLFELGEYVKSLPEYQTMQDKSFREGLSGELEGYDTRFFEKTSPKIMSQYAKAGIKNSSALDYAMTDLMGQLAEKRGGYLANLSAQQYGGNKEAARQDYLSSMNQFLSDQYGAKNRAYGLMDYYNQRGDQTADYNRQMRDYLNFLNSQKKEKTNAWDYLNAGLNIANTAAHVAMPFVI